MLIFQHFFFHFEYLPKTTKNISITVISLVYNHCVICIMTTIIKRAKASEQHEGDEEKAENRLGRCVVTKIRNLIYLIRESYKNLRKCQIRNPSTSCFSRTHLQFVSWPGTLCRASDSPMSPRSPSEWENIHYIVYSRSYLGCIRNPQLSFLPIWAFIKNSCTEVL